MTGSGWKLQLLTNISIYRFSNPKNGFSRKFIVRITNRSRNQEKYQETKKIQKKKKQDKSTNQEITKKSRINKEIKYG